MTVRFADGGPQALYAATIGVAWTAVARQIIVESVASRYDDRPVREMSLVTLAVDRPDPGDEVIASYGKPGQLAWMHANFTSRCQVAALGDADSYATRCSTTSIPAVIRSPGSSTGCDGIPGRARR